MKNTRNRKKITDKHILELIQECKDKCTELGYVLPTNLRFLQCKAVRRAGLACHPDKTIVLSDFLFKEDDKAIKTTILHEIGHIIAGPYAKHGPVWQKIVRKISLATGLNITRCYNDADMPVHATAVAQSYKYNFICNGCGCQVHYTRMTSFVTTYNETMSNGKPRWTCRHCGGTFAKIN